MRCMRILTKIILVCVAAALLIFGIVQLYYYLTYTRYEVYKTLLSDYTPAVSTGGFAALSNDTLPGASGMVLAEENDRLRLFVNPATADVAVMDKKTGGITYSNPPDADKN